MSDLQPPSDRQAGAPAPAPGQPEIVVVPGSDGAPGERGAEATAGEAVAEPAKVMRIGAMVRQLLEEVRRAPLDERGRARLREIHETAIREVAEGLSPDLQQELAQFSLPFVDSTPSEAELRVAQAQLVGWLEGLFHGIQAALFAQQMAARAQLEELHRRGLPPGQRPIPEERERPGTYL
jgi:hypothetical protein